ncbi:MAG: 4Fe-4S binding protein, partial [Pyramidobacter sp.]|nr:4Fe-4S binding protein [Pyramidobacter sp.]
AGMRALCVYLHEATHRQGKPLDGKKLRFDYSKCIRCYCCHEMCPFDAIVFHEGALMRVFKALGLARR